MGIIECKMVFKTFEQTKFISQIEINKFLDYEINLFFRAFSNSQVHKLENNFFFLSFQNLKFFLKNKNNKKTNSL